MAMNSPRPQTGALSDRGKLYIYTGEELDAIAVAMHWTGPSGGWTGISVARMALPSKALTQQQLNDFARLFASAPDLLEALKAILSEETISVHVGYDHGPGGGNYVYADAIRTDTAAFEKARAALSKASPNTNQDTEGRE